MTWHPSDPTTQASDDHHIRAGETRGQRAAPKMSVPSNARTQQLYVLDHDRSPPLRPSRSRHGECEGRPSPSGRHLSPAGASQPAERHLAGRAESTRSVRNPIAQVFAARIQPRRHLSCLRACVVAVRTGWSVSRVRVRHRASTRDVRCERASPLCPSSSTGRSTRGNAPNSARGFRSWWGWQEDFVGSFHVGIA